MASRIWRWNGSAMVEVSPWGFTKVAVSGQTDVVADVENDTLTLVAGTGVTITTSDAADSVTVAIGQSVATTATPSFAAVTVTGATAGVNFVDRDATNDSSVIYRQANVLNFWKSPATAGDIMTLGDSGELTIIGDAGRKIFLSAVTNNYIQWANSGVAAPATATISAGMKLSLYGTPGGGTAPYAIGVNSSKLWLGVPASAGFDFYVSTTAVASIGSTGNMDINGNLYGGAGVYGAGSTGSVYTANVAGMGYVNGDRLSVANPQGVCFSAGTGATAGGTIVPYTIYGNATVGTLQGGLSLATNGTVAISAFAGLHWSQLETGGRSDILFGSVVESVNELCVWPEEDESNARLARFKISDTPGSNSVYGVFIDWNDFGPDADEYPDDANIMSLGAFFIRIAAGVVVQNGDLIESNGDGCGRVQADNIMRACTIAKITSDIRYMEYEDGSYVVPCTLHCG